MQGYSRYSRCAVAHSQATAIAGYEVYCSGSGGIVEHFRQREAGRGDIRVKCTVHSCDVGWPRNVAMTNPRWRSEGFEFRWDNGERRYA